MGAVATTFVAGVEAVRKGISHPIGSLTQMERSVSGSAPTGGLQKSKSSFRSPGSMIWSSPAGHFRRQHVRRRRNAGVLERDLLDKVKAA